MDETESPELAYSGGFGAGYGSYSTNVPGGRSGYSGASRGYLNSEYNRGGFGSKYAAASKVGLLPAGTKARTTPAAATRSKAVALAPGMAVAASTIIPVLRLLRRAVALPLRPPHPHAKRPPTLQPGDLVDHKVFGRGKVLKATPIAGDCIVEIQFDRVGVKKTMANYAPLKKVEE